MVLAYRDVEIRSRPIINRQVISINRTRMRAATDDRHRKYFRVKLKDHGFLGSSGLSPAIQHVTAGVENHIEHDVIRLNRINQRRQLMHMLVSRIILSNVDFIFCA